MSEPSGRPFVLALVALIVLTAVSYGISHVDLGPANAPIALAIAAGKAVIVAVAFMELRHASLPARVTSGVTLAFIALLCSGTVADVAFR